MKALRASVVTIALLVLLAVSFQMVYAQVPTSTVLPAYRVSQLPSESDFTIKSQDDLLPNYPHYTVVRANGEKVDGYFFFDESSKNFEMIFYFEDKTGVTLHNYVPFNSDYFGLSLKSDSGQERYIYSERNGIGCMFGIEHLEDYWAGKFSGCEGGATITKTTPTGWAVFIKFFKDVPNPLEQNYYLKWSYGDIQEVNHYQMKKFEAEKWPESDYGKISLMSSAKPSLVSVNSGKITVDDFLYKPYELLTQGLTKNTFACANDINDIIKVSTDLTNYNATYHIARITAKMNSETPPNTIYLKIYDSENNVIFKDSQQSSTNQDVLFLVDVSKFLDGYYKAEVQYGTTGSKGTYQFAVGKNYVVDNKGANDCYFYLLYNKSSKNLSFLANVRDITNNDLDHIQIFVDRNGDGINDIDSNDLSVVIDKSRFGAYILNSNGSWNEPKNTPGIQDTGEGRIKILDTSYQVLINVPNVSENFRFALEQDDISQDGSKISRYPPGGFATVSSTWSSVSFVDALPPSYVSDKWQPKEITSTQKMRINLILVGNSWSPEVKEKIQSKLVSSYTPIIAQEMATAGIKYDYDYNFVSLPDKASNELFDFMKSQAADVKPFYGENDYDHPWGIALWIQSNHTEWADNASKTYKIGYKLINADKMEDYIQKNIITSDPNLSSSTSANLIFISDNLDKISFLHNYNLQRYDSASKTFHNAVGLMGYGGKYNFYFFDLYAVPWDNSFELPALYDFKLNNFATDLHDLKTQDGYVQLISDYTNNATSMIITPSYLYAPVYKQHYTLDLIIVHKPSANIGSITNILDYYIDQDKIKSQLQDLMPYSTWEIQTTLANQDSEDLPDDLKGAIKDIKTVTPFPGLPSYSVDVLDSQKVANATLGWGSTNTIINENDFKNFDKPDLGLPAIEVVSSSDRPIFIDTWGEDGVATQNPNKPTEPCCALGVIDSSTVWTQKVSMTRLVLHEVGHTLGLMHPFMGYSSDGKPHENEYFNWYDSVMANNPPPDGCSLWFDAVLATDPIDKTCGISDTIYTKFEKDNLARGIANYLIKTAKEDTYLAEINLEQRGTDPNNFPQDIKDKINDIQTKLSEAQSSFDTNDMLYDNGAIHYGLLGAQESSDLLRLSTSSTSPSTATTISYQIPSWIKNNAKWWSEGSIDDSEFIKGMQYLVQQGIMKIPPTQQNTTSNGIPSWIKKNAGWWANGQISDDEFVKGIQWLISNGIIKIKS